MKGQKTGGRQPGSSNKVTIELKTAWKDFTDQNFPKLQGWLDSVAKEDPAEAFKLYLSMSERIIGKVTASQIDLTSNGKTLQSPVLILNGNPPTDNDRG